MKKVSVIVTCYNHGQYIEQCLRSIFNQTHTNIDLMIINDGSTDNSDEIIRKTIQDSPFQITEYIFQENQGSCVSRNTGLDWATGDYVLIVDSDNYLDIDHIEKSLNVLEETGKDIAYASLRDADTKEVINEVPEFSLGRFITANFIDTCSLIRYSVINEHRFDIKLNRLFMQDYDFFLGMVYDGARPIKVIDLYQNYRILPNSLANRATNKQDRIKWIEVYSYINHKYPEYTGNATNLLGGWYLEMNSFQQSELDRKIEEQRLLKEKIEEQKKSLIMKEMLLQEKDRYIQNLENTKAEIMNSSTWKVGRGTTLPLRKLKDLCRKSKTAYKIYKESGLSGIKSVLTEKNDGSLKQEDMYQNWIHRVESLKKNEELADLTKFSYNPLISILIPVYNVEKKWLKKCLQSIEKQWYSNWEVCIADDASTNQETLDYLQELSNIENNRIKVVFREKNGHISKATNSALEIAEGEFIALVDNDDELAINALYEVVKALNEQPNLNLIYSDEDKINQDGVRFDPHFKPDWSPDLILNQNYISHLGVYRTTISKKIKGFRADFEGAQDHDFLLRFTECIDPATIKHIPHVLYHWRAIEGSTALAEGEKDYAFTNGIKMIQEAFIRRGIKAKVTQGQALGLYDIQYEIIDNPLVSIIIPTRNGYDDLKMCIDSIIEKSSYKNYEIIVADNGSDDPKMNELFQGYKERLNDRFKNVLLDIPFNYSRINNLAVKESNGNYLLFLNNDTSVITPEWIEVMLGFAQFDRVGCVGAKLWYFDDTIQHGGVIVGLGGVAGHSFHNSTKQDPGYFRRLYTDYNYTAVTAACLMVSKKDFQLVDGFDENLEVAFNDIDLCIRIYQLGRDNVWAHKAELYHYESKSRGYEDTPEKKKRFEGEIAKMKNKHGNFLMNDPAYNPNFSLDVLPFTKIGR